MDDRAYDLIEKLGEKLQIGTTEILEAYTRYVVGLSIAWTLFGIALILFSWKVWRKATAISASESDLSAEEKAARRLDYLNSGNDTDAGFVFGIVFSVVGGIIGAVLLAHNLAVLLAPKGAAISKLIGLLAK